MTTSGTYNFELSNADIIQEAFDRIEIRPPAITGPHMISAKRSLNLELQRWANAGMPLMWAVDVISIDLIQGVQTYNLPQETADLLDVYIRTYTLTNIYNLTPNVSTTINSTAVTVNIPNNGLVVGNFVNFATPVAIGGILLTGFYQIATTPNLNSFTIVSPEAATSTVNNGGVVPLFTAVGGQMAIRVTLPNHGMAVNELFNILVSTTVGGVILLGAYTITGVIDANNFGISIPYTVVFNDAQYENAGLMQINGQNQSAAPVDYIITPLGRTDYAGIPDKTVQGRPTSYWYDRTATQNITLWQVPDNNGPYQLQAYRMRRLQDASPTMGQTPDIVYRAIDALCGQMALRLAMKYAKDMIAIIKPDADAAWEDLMKEDRERAQIMLLPDLESYYRD